MLDHIIITVSDYEASKRFYLTALELYEACSTDEQRASLHAIVGHRWDWVVVPIVGSLSDDGSEVRIEFELTPPEAHTEP